MKMRRDLPKKLKKVIYTYLQVIYRLSTLLLDNEGDNVAKLDAIVARLGAMCNAFTPMM